MVDKGFLSNNMKFPSYKMLNDIYTMKTPYWLYTELDLLPNFERILQEICHRGRLLLRTDGPVPLDMHMFYFLRPIPFSELVVIFTDYALRISIGTFSI